jgi:hypothetical protein
MDPKQLEEGGIAASDASDNSPTTMNGLGGLNGGVSGGEALQRMVTSGTLPPDLFERLYLQPQVSPDLGT